MPTRNFRQIALAHFLVVGCAVVFGAYVLTEQVQAQQQFVPPPPPPTPPPPPPVFNPPSPNRTVPQPSYTPISPSTPSAVPGYSVTSPAHVRLPRTAARSHERTSVAKARPIHHRYRSVVAGPAPETYPNYYSPFFGYYGCAWQRAWDGYWFRTSPCS
jgi:hypothetical protein